MLTPAETFEHIIRQQTAQQLVPFLLGLNKKDIVPMRQKTLILKKELAGITRLHLRMHVGRKTFATLKIHQGVPRSQVLVATGHQTEAYFNRYLGIDEKELMESYRRTARKVVAETGDKSVQNVA